MTTPDFVTMLFNLSGSLPAVFNFISGLSYLTGMYFIFIALVKLKKIADHRTGSGGQHSVFVPMVTVFIGSALLFLPQAVKIASATTFGSSNILSYARTGTPQTILGATVMLLKVAGLIWFVRGCVLLVNASEPGVQDGPKGAAFLCGGILGLNMASVVEVIRAIVNKIMHLF